MYQRGGMGCIRLRVGRLTAAVVAFVLVPSLILAAVKADLSGARSAIDEHRFQEAADLILPALKENEKDADAQYLLGEAYAGLEHWEDAAQSYQAAIDNKFKGVNAIVGLANALIALGRAGEVPALIEKPLGKVKDRAEAAMLKNVAGRAQYAMGNYSKAQEWFLGARYDDEANLEYRVDLGNAYFAGQVYPLAASEYEAVLAADSSRLDLMYQLGEIYYQQRRLTEARTVFADLLERDSTFHEAYFRLANIYMIAAQSKPVNEATDLYKAALSLYRKVRDVDPNADPVLVSKNIATVYYLLNAHDSAMVELQNALDAGATDPELNFYLGRSSMLLNEYSRAIESFALYRSKLEAQNPPHEWVAADAELFWRTAVCMEALQDSTLIPQIAENYRRAVQLDPDDERSIAGLALSNHKLGRYAEAAVEFEKLVVKHPNESRILFNASLPYMQLNNDEKAVEYLLRAAENDTTVSQTYRERGYKLAAPRLIKMQRIADAQKAYKWLIEREPNVCDHRQWYGFTLFSVKDYAGAAPQLQRAYKCFETLGGDACKYNELRWWLAFALYEAGEKDASYKLCEKVVECTPGNKDARDLMNRIDEEIIEEN
jgi:tetratricopeptide (TPR) repeat protein